MKADRARVDSQLVASCMLCRVPMDAVGSNQVVKRTDPARQIIAVITSSTTW